MLFISTGRVKGEPMKLKLSLIFFLTLSFSSVCRATILACADEIDEMKAKKEKEGLGLLGEQSCKDSKIGPKARYKPNSPWSCTTLKDFPCVSKTKLRMIQCDREWECY